jgi:single-stranded DNA-binding protein
MKRTYINAQATGIVGADPVIVSLPTGTVATLSIGVGVSYADPAVGRTCERVEWHHLIAAGTIAERVRQTVTKGCRIKVEGVLRSEIEHEKLTNKPLLRTRLLIQSLEVLEKPQPRPKDAPAAANRLRIVRPPKDELWEQEVEFDLDF